MYTVENTVKSVWEMQRAVMVMDVLILKWCDKTGSACEGCDIDIWTDLSFSVSSPSLSLFSHKNKMGYQPYDHVETVPIKSPSNPTRVGDPWFFHQWLLPFLFPSYTPTCVVCTLRFLDWEGSRCVLGTDSHVPSVTPFWHTSPVTSLPPSLSLSDLLRRFSQSLSFLLPSFSHWSVFLPQLCPL